MKNCNSAHSLTLVPDWTNRPLVKNARSSLVFAQSGSYSKTLESNPSSVPDTDILGCFSIQQVSLLQPCWLSSSMPLWSCGAKSRWWVQQLICNIFEINPFLAVKLASSPGPSQLIAVEKYREKAWDQNYVTDWKWWTRLVQTESTISSP